MDAVISSAVLHFARDHAHFDAMVQQLWRVLAPGGVFFCRLASSIGMEDRMRPIGDGRFHLPDGSVRYLVDEPRLMALTTGWAACCSIRSRPPWCRISAA